MFAELQRMFHFSLSLPDRASEMRSEHQALIDALAEGDAAAAERATIDQLRASRAMVLDALLSSELLLDVKIGGSDGKERFL